MHSRSSAFALLAALLLCGVAGCNKSADTSTGKNPGTPAQDEAKQSPPFDTIARVHWLGIKGLGAETNAAYFMSIWNLPETARLEAQTLDKLALWLAGQQAGVRSRQSAVGSRESAVGIPQSAAGNQRPGNRSQGAGTNELHNASGDSQIKNQKSKIKNALAPLLEDLLNQECYLEIRAGTNQPPELALAIRLDDARSRLWQTNLATTLESLTGTQPAWNSSPSSGWQLLLASRSSIQQAATSNQQPVISNQYPVISNQPVSSSNQHPASSTLSLEPFRSWTLLGLGSGSNATLFAEFRARIAHHGAPFTAPATNIWLDAQADLPRISSAFDLDWRLHGNCPKTTLTVVGDGQNVRTHGQLDFPRALPIELEPWNIPTNLIHDPLIGFTAIRGFRPWLESFKPWQDLKAGATPNQAYVWDQEGLPAQEYGAIPVPHADSFVHNLSEPLRKTANPMLRARRMGQLEDATNFDGIAWNSAPFVAPELRVISDSEGEFVLGGLIPLVGTNMPAPAELLHEVSSRANLLFYDWEITGQGLDHWLYLSQLFRLLLDKVQLPSDALTFQWAKAVAPKLGNCVTLVSVAGPSRLELVRKSSFGLSSIELHLLADWLESPQFPYGLHTFLAPPPPAPTPPPSTNSAPHR